MVVTNDIDQVYNLLQEAKATHMRNSLANLSVKVRNSTFVRVVFAPVAQAGLWLKDIRYKHSDWSKLIESMENMYAGESCFIVGNGPSLTTNDLEAISNAGVFTFASNRIYLLFDETTWRPSAYLAMDKSFIVQEVRRLGSIEAGLKFISALPSTHKLKNSDGFILINCHSRLHTIKKHSSKRVDFSRRPDRVIYDGSTVTFVAMQLALFMGFSNIYLIGVDHTYSHYIDTHGKLHVNNGVVDHAYIDPAGAIVNPQNKALVELAYNMAKEEALHKGARILNATRGGSLEIFERVDIDELLGNVSDTKHHIQ